MCALILCAALLAAALPHPGHTADGPLSEPDAAPAAALPAACAAALPAGNAAAEVERLAALVNFSIATADRSRLVSLLDDLAHARGSARERSARACLQQHAALALDGLNGWRYLTAERVPAHRLVDEAGRPLVNPVDFAVQGDAFYVIDAGTLYGGRLPAAGAGGVFALTPLLARSARVEGDPIQELAAVAPGAQPGDLYALDRAGTLLRRLGREGAWERFVDRPPESGGATPQYTDLLSDEDGLLLLDIAGNQIVRVGWSGAQSVLFTGERSWAAGAFGRAVALAVAGGAFHALLDDGKLIVAGSAGRRTVDLGALSAPSHLAAIAAAHVQPAALAADPASGLLYIADRANRRILALAPDGGALVAQYAAPGLPAFGRISGLQVARGILYAIAGDSLFRLDPAQEPAPAALLPAWAPEPAAGAPDLARAAPHDPATLAALRRLALTMPIAGAALPARPSLYPGARRAYRYGVHRGIDFFAADSGVPISVGTPVRAVLDGVIWRADHDYMEMSAAEVAAYLARANARHGLPQAILDRLGGRQVWVRHEGGLWSVYSHLDAIPADMTPGTRVRAGDVIASVGVSGTPEGIYGDLSAVHLHFELWLGELPRAWVGQWLPLAETMALYRALFAEASAGAAALDFPADEVALGPPWPAFSPAHPAQADHAWLAAPFAEEHNRTPSNGYLFGETLNGSLRPHHGIDIENDTGTPVLAMAAGAVVFAGPDNPGLLGPYNDFYGNAVVVRLTRAWQGPQGALPVYLLYGHLDSVRVRAGQAVRAGQWIGTVGETGIAMGPHLHVEVRMGANTYDHSVNPLLWWRPAPGLGTLAVRVTSAEGQAWDGATLTLYPAGSDRPAAYGTTYRSSEGVQPDPAWGENAVIPNLRAGWYRLVVHVGEEQIERRVRIASGITSFVALRTLR